MRWHKHLLLLRAFFCCSFLRLPFDEMGIDHGWSIKSSVLLFHNRFLGMRMRIGTVFCKYLHSYIVRIHIFSYFHIFVVWRSWKCRKEMLDFILKTKGIVMTHGKVLTECEFELAHFLTIRHIFKNINAMWTARNNKRGKRMANGKTKKNVAKESEWKATWKQIDGLSAFRLKWTIIIWSMRWTQEDYFIWWNCRWKTQSDTKEKKESANWKSLLRR